MMKDNKKGTKTSPKGKTPASGLAGRAAVVVVALAAVGSLIAGIGLYRSGGPAAADRPAAGRAMDRTAIIRQEAYTLPDTAAKDGAAPPDADQRIAESIRAGQYLCTVEPHYLLTVANTDNGPEAVFTTEVWSEAAGGFVVMPVARCALYQTGDVWHSQDGALRLVRHGQAAFTVCAGGAAIGGLYETVSDNLPAIDHDALPGSYTCEATGVTIWLTSRSAPNTYQLSTPRPDDPAHLDVYEVYAGRTAFWADYQGHALLTLVPDGEGLVLTTVGYDASLDYLEGVYHP